MLNRGKQLDNKEHLMFVAQKRSIGKEAAVCSLVQWDKGNITKNTIVLIQRPSDNDAGSLTSKLDANNDYKN